MQATISQKVMCVSFSPTGHTPRVPQDHPSPDPAAVAGIGLGAVPRQRRAVEMRERLYAAALDEFEAETVPASRIERVVAKVGTSWGTFFRYFPRKEDVLILAGVRHYREHIRPIVEDGLRDPERPRGEIARAAFAALAQPQRTARLHAEILFETARFPLRFAAMLDEGERPLVALFTALMVDAQERGEVRADVPAPICATVLTSGVIFSTIQMLLAVDRGQLPATNMPAVADLAFDAAWTGLRAAA
jgi:AcrR family transcriptional regulator